MKGPGLEGTELQSALEAADRASEQAYAPYSSFRVGAAVVTQDGELYAGCNVENASYGMTVCAERNAVAAMVLAGGRRVRLVAVVSPEASPAFPCGACRQVLHEFGCEEVVVRDASGVRRYPFEALLPRAFGPEDL